MRKTTTYVLAALSVVLVWVRTAAGDGFGNSAGNSTSSGFGNSKSGTGTDTSDSDKAKTDSKASDQDREKTEQANKDEAKKDDALRQKAAESRGKDQEAQKRATAAEADQAKREMQAQVDELPSRAQNAYQAFKAKAAMLGADEVEAHRVAMRKINDVRAKARADAIAAGKGKYEADDEGDKAVEKFPDVAIAQRTTKGAYDRAVKRAKGLGATAAEADRIGWQAQAEADRRGEIVPPLRDQPKPAVAPVTPSGDGGQLKPGASPGNGGK